MNRESIYDRLKIFGGMGVNALTHIPGNIVDQLGYLGRDFVQSIFGNTQN